jgi:hypothetical protein
MTRDRRNDRPVDRFRNAGGQGRIEGDSGPILSMFPLQDERLYFICERGITSMQMADQIDPERMNPNLPRMVQRPELAYGATTAFIQRTLCIGAELFDQTYLPETVRRDDAMGLALEAAEVLADVQDNINALADSEADVRRRMGAGEQPMHVIPRTTNLRQRVEGSVNGLRKAVLRCQSVADLFYVRPHNANFTEHLRGVLEAQLDADDIAWPMLNWAFEAQRVVSNNRNAMIHADGNKRMVLRDYELEANGQLVAPTVEFIHPESPQPRVDVVHFLKGWLDDVSAMFEAYVAILCDRNARQWAEGIKSNVALSDQDRRTGTRYFWHTVFLEGFPRNASHPVR